MPIIGMLIGGVDFTGLQAKIGEATITYGTFIQNVLDFLIVAFCIFFFVRGIERMKNIINFFKLKLEIFQKDEKLHYYDKEKNQYVEIIQEDGTPYTYQEFIGNQLKEIEK